MIPLQKRGKQDRWIEIVLDLTALLFSLPILYVIFSSFRFEGKFGFDQYRGLLYMDAYFRALKNSLFYAVIATVIGTLSALPIAYLFAKIAFKGRDVLFLVYIFVLMLPAQSTILGQFIMMKKMNLLNTKPAVLIPLIMSPIVVLLLRQNLKSIDGELIEAAKIETNSFGIIMRHILLPQIKESLFAAVLLMFCECWNVAEPAMILLPNAVEERPLSILMNTVPDVFCAAAATVYMLPVFIFAIVFAKKLKNKKWSVKE